MIKFQNFEDTIFFAYYFIQQLYNILVTNSFKPLWIG